MYEYVYDYGEDSELVLVLVHLLVHEPTHDFDVALHVVFKNKAAHDTYQTAERHLKFIKECQDQWEKVRVFDSYVWVSDHGPTPDKAAGGEHAK